MVEIFADEGISGTTSNNRTQFQRMTRLCEQKQIDLILTKSISRFARNTKETLEYVRKLKLLGVGVQFEKEGIDTLSLGDGMLLSTFAAIAQEESVSISQNVRIGIHKRMEMGKYVNGCAPYGYRLTDGEIIPYEPECAVVRQIFQSYLDGESTLQIAQKLNQDQIQNKRQGINWSSDSVKYILTNERYIGNCLYQKSYHSPTVPFRKRNNRGEMDQYYVSDTHNTHDAWSKSIRPRKKEKSGDFERFLRFFRACLFSNLYRSIFDISSSRRDRTTENTLFGEFNNEHKRPEGLEPTTGFQILPVFCVRHKMFTNSALQKHSIPSVGGSEPTKQLKTTFSKSLHRLRKRIRTTENQILHR